MSTMLAFHSQPAIKAKYLERVRMHKKADAIIKGQYWEDGKGCAIGCTLHSSNHLAYETELGIPVQLAYLEDDIFENLPNGHAKEFPERFLKAINPGADLSRVVNKFLVWLLVDGVSGVIRFAQTEGQKTAISNVAALHQQVIDGNPPPAAAWDAARDAARAAAGAAAWDAARDAAGAAAGDAAWDAARDAAGAAAWAAARAAAGAAAGAAAWAAVRDAARDAVRDAARDAVRDAARDAVRDAARDAAWVAVRDAAYISFADKLIELLEQA